ncbi:hypothetical protein LY78DRAFT_441939 [Colletotrichum sublineola]|nr:hypothetical protein LY78DRAFT_441939 [Colletotrichum sublineola]
MAWPWWHAIATPGPSSQLSRHSHPLFVDTVGFAAAARCGAAQVRQISQVSTPPQCPGLAESIRIPHVCALCTPAAPGPFPRNIATCKFLALIFFVLATKSRVSDMEYLKSLLAPGPISQSQLMQALNIVLPFRNGYVSSSWTVRSTRQIQ